MAKYTYQLQLMSITGRWVKDCEDSNRRSIKDKIDEASGCKRVWYDMDWRVVRKQGRKIVKVIYQTK